MKFIQRPFSLVFLVLILLFSCREPAGNAGKKDASLPAGNTSPLPGGILRYEKALFGIPKDNFEAGLNKIAGDYTVFLGKAPLSPEAVGQLKEFVSNRQNQEVYAECMKQFADLQPLTEEFNKALERWLEAVPGSRIPAVYTYVSGFDFEYPIKYTDSALIIALDMYLGSEYPGYRTMGIPQYISRRLTPEHILPDCMKELALPLIAAKESPVLLDAMIEEGKALYFTDVMLPDTDDNLKIGYSKEQMDWCYGNENNLWSFLIENELLFSADAKSMSMFMTDGPFTASFSQESPSRTGAWLGWQIVRSYMKNNKTGLTDLLADKNSQGILEKSGYKPRKK